MRSFFTKLVLLEAISDLLAALEEVQTQLAATEGVDKRLQPVLARVQAAIQDCHSAALKQMTAQQPDVVTKKDVHVLLAELEEAWAEISRLQVDNRTMGVFLDALGKAALMREDDD